MLIKQSNKNFDFEVVGTSEWDIDAIISYDAIHHGSVGSSNLTKVLKRVSKNKLETISDCNKYLSQFTFSKDGKNPLSNFSKLSSEIIVRLCIANIRNKNFGDVCSLKNKTLPTCDLLTYSFPCQDLSVANMGRAKGMKKNSGTRSGLLWEIEKILQNYVAVNAPPKYLILENVGNMLSKKFKPEYENWIKALSDIGYITKTFDEGLKATDFGIPQKRKRIFAISIHKEMNIESFEKKLQTQIYSRKRKVVFTKKYLFEKFLIGGKYPDEINGCLINPTPSRIRMINENKKWDESLNEYVIPTITTKQDRHPNCGSLPHENKRRFLSPRELFLLMGFQEKDFDNIKNDCYCVRNGSLYKQAGNSIVVNVLKALFESLESTRL